MEIIFERSGTNVIEGWFCLFFIGCSSNFNLWETPQHLFLPTLMRMPSQLCLLCLVCTFQDKVAEMFKSVVVRWHGQRIVLYLCKEIIILILCFSLKRHFRAFACIHLKFHRIHKFQVLKTLISPSN